MPLVGAATRLRSEPSRVVTIYYPDVAPVPVPDGHRFPTGKYALLRARVAADGVLGRARLSASPSIDRQALLRAHAPDYVDAVFDGSLDAQAVRRIGLPWSPELVQRARATVGGSLAAARAALREGFSGQLAGGTHHAHRDFGSGFCVFNDLAVAALTLIDELQVARIAVVDLDVHQGDGNAALLRDVPGLFVLSIQGAKNFPFRRVAAHLDVELPDGTEDAAYLAALQTALEPVVAARPQLVLYLSGADPLREDTLGRLSLTHTGLAARDRLVFETFHRLGVPVAVVIGGGYARPIDLSVTAYANTFAVAREVYGF
jgi:acetoin utilization deacetylase AcuC-like enzyme